MKKIMSLMLGLSLLSGMAVFADNKPADTTKSTSKSTKTKSTASKGKKKKATTTAPSGGK
jgi:hypothetical protein